VTESELPPGRLRRVHYLLVGRLDPRTAHPLELAAAAKHVLTHPNLEADAWRRSREDQGLADVRMTLGNWGVVQLGEATLRAVAIGAGSEECVRCRANLIARVRRLPLPGFDAATVYLLGRGCARCRQSARPDPRPADAGGHTGTAPPTSTRLALSPQTIASMVAAVPPGAPAKVWRLLRERLAQDPDGLSLPTISDDSVHPGLR
jgi:hypothetical protein